MVYEAIWSRISAAEAVSESARERIQAHAAFLADVAKHNPADLIETAIKSFALVHVAARLEQSTVLVDSLATAGRKAS